jgi:HD-GYP domain-containing protein (c-di-GMP phosphodiesterase class II)
MNPKTIILRDSGRHFDAVIVEAFCRRFDDFLRAQEEAVDDFPISHGAMALREYDLAVADV